MNTTHGTPLHRKHFNTRCNCSDCQTFDNADTLILDTRRSMPPQHDTPVAFEQVITIHAETGERTVYLWPLYRRDVTNQPHPQRRIRGFHNATTTVFTNLSLFSEG